MNIEVSKACAPNALVAARARSLETRCISLSKIGGGSKLDNQNEFKSDHGRDVPLGELPSVAVVLEI